EHEIKKGRGGGGLTAAHMASSSSPSTSSLHYRSRFGDTTLTKVFVGGLAWETPTAELRRFFEQFGEILEAVIISDKITGRSKGYGFVTFRDPESARRSVADPNPVIDGRRANCNIAAFGRPRPSPPRGVYDIMRCAIPTTLGMWPIQLSMDTNKLVLLPFFCVFVSAETGDLHFDADLPMVSKELVSVQGKSKSS
ncbi:hypothetical protein B296_00055520, partial [Ensete ventricosum]